MSAILGWGLLGLGLLVLAVAGIGLLRLPDALSRQHASTKAGTLGLALMIAGTFLAGGQDGWLPRLLALAAILMLTLPVAGHALARLAWVERGRDAEDASPSGRDG
jgi:multicomponent Na+:H+ antiporter subunit G